MTATPDWWHKPRRLSVVVDNPSWILPVAERLVAKLNGSGDDAALCRGHAEVRDGVAAFYLGCTHMTPPHVLACNRRNLVVHESDLPQGRGFSPLTWQILEGRAEVPVCLLEADREADSGPVIYRETIRFAGHELIGEMRGRLGDTTVGLCRRFLSEPSPPAGVPQAGAPTFYSRRKPRDSRIDPRRSIADQFDLLRVVDTERYPAFFEWLGHRYKLTIEKAPRGDCES